MNSVAILSKQKHARGERGSSRSKCDGQKSFPFHDIEAAFFMVWILRKEKSRLDIDMDQTGALWPLVVYFAAAVSLAAAMIGLSYFLGQRHKERATGLPYESGVASTGTARVRFDIKFYLIAMFFVIFDVEAVFIFAWAVALKETGWEGYFEILVFIWVLLAALLYLWKTGGLDWAKKKRKVERAG